MTRPYLRQLILADLKEPIKSALFLCNAHTIISCTVTQGPITILTGRRIFPQSELSPHPSRPLTRGIV